MEDSAVYTVEPLDWHRMNKLSRMLSGSLFDFYNTGEADLIAHADLSVTSCPSLFRTELKTKEMFLSSTMKSCGLLRSQSFPLQALPKATGNSVVKISRTLTGLGIGRQLLSPSHEPAVKDNNSTVRDEGIAGSSNFSVYQTARERQQCNQPEDKEKGDENPVVCPPGTEAYSEETVLVDAAAPVTHTVLAESATHTPNVVCSEDGSQEECKCFASPRCAIKLALDVGVTNPSASCGVCTSSQFVADGKCPPCGKLLVCGRRREMEDTVAIVPSFVALHLQETECENSLAADETQPTLVLHFFGVYDGHGGSQASSYCMDKLHLLLADELKSHIFRGCTIKLDGAQWESILKASYLKMDKEVGGVCPTGFCDDDVADITCLSCGDAIAPGNVGTTALVAIVGSSQIVVANCGDSRAVLYRHGKAIPLSRDHKPERADETSRIEAAGGRVICWDGYRVGGLLALSRAIGIMCTSVYVGRRTHAYQGLYIHGLVFAMVDFLCGQMAWIYSSLVLDAGDRYLKRYIISDPEVTCMERLEDDEFMILASDGLWDVVSNEHACEFARKCLLAGRRKRVVGVLASPMKDPATTSAATLLVKLAFNRGSKDNISVVVVDLKTNC